MHFGSTTTGCRHRTRWRVVPAQAGTQHLRTFLDTGFRRCDKRCPGSAVNVIRLK